MSINLILSLQFLWRKSNLEEFSAYSIVSNIFMVGSVKAFYLYTSLPTTIGERVNCDTEPVSYK